MDLFRWRTGVPRAVAALVLDGFRGSADHDAYRKLLRAKPYKADRAAARVYEDARRRLGAAGRCTVLAAALPADPAALWAPGGTTAAADRMATAWATLLGTAPYTDDGSHAAALAAEHGLPEAWAAALLTGRAPEHLDADGVRAAAAAVVWALTERPVGDPAAAGARTLIDHLGDAPACSPGSGGWRTGRRPPRYRPASTRPTRSSASPTWWRRSRRPSEPAGTPQPSTSNSMPWAARPTARSGAGTCGPRSTTAPSARNSPRRRRPARHRSGPGSGIGTGPVANAA
ncbi:hypothetical protein SALCHL_006137 [Streptomyces albus subsp. chlorinus]|uniref:hypothetical protein n=1 Tax=Streptomyces albus TaxID=1888 RepID=UPI003D12CB9C